MAQLIFNEVLRLATDSLEGFYRVVAQSEDGRSIWLAYAGGMSLQKPDADGKAVAASNSPALGSLHPVAVQTLRNWEQRNQMSAVDIALPARQLRAPEELTTSEREQWEWRVRTAQPMLDPLRVQALVGPSGRLGALVREVCKQGPCSRPLGYQLWAVLVQFGFTQAALIPRYAACGAPGVRRPVSDARRKSGRPTLKQVLGAPDPQPQRGLEEADHPKILHHYRRLMRPGLSLGTLYRQIVEAAYVTQYQQEGDIRVPILPPAGSFPNQRQVRYVIESSVKDLERVLRNTTQGHFNRNLRGIRGRAYDGVPGPGHTYAIDSTIGDIHLRSRICPAWIVGRPIVYVVVDVWSTAVVGFYACLEGPAWRDAKLALFSTLCDPALLGDLWGYEPIQTLWPRPQQPYRLRCDRGEYLSAAAKETGLALRLNLEFAPPRRPDWKGTVEVLHRIMKDEQYRFLPGAIDARRKELELRRDAKESALNLREYVQYLHGLFAHYNLYADRSHRMTAEMIAVGVDPTPAGLWRFGHDAGLAFGQAVSPQLLFTSLLAQGQAVVRRDGIFWESSEYEAEVALRQQWTAQARNFGAREQGVHFFPGSTSRFWWANPDGGLEEFRLKSNARAIPEASLYDWRDALMVERMKQDDRAYRKLQAATRLAAQQEHLRKQALERTREAHEAIPPNAIPQVRDARLLERMTGANALPAPAQQEVETEDQASEGYTALMDAVFAEMNRAPHA